MNKIYSEQVQKAEMLSQGVVKHAETLRSSGINIDAARLDTACRALEAAATEQEKAEETLRAAREKAHALLSELKDLYLEAKTPVKLNYPPEQWVQFGIPDKR